MFAVIETGGKQYLVREKQKLRVEKLDGEAGGKLAFDKVLLIVDDKGADIGRPYLSNAKVEGEILGEGRGKKITMMKYHSKTRYRRKKGHRQSFTEVQITSIAK